MYDTDLLATEKQFILTASAETVTQRKVTLLFVWSHRLFTSETKRWFLGYRKKSTTRQYSTEEKETYNYFGKFREKAPDSEFALVWFTGKKVIVTQE